MLRRQLERERARRQAAESIGERVTADLYETVRELRAAQDGLLERADRDRLVTDIGRELRQEPDSQRLIDRASKLVGIATGVDRCQVRLGALPGRLQELLDQAGGGPRDLEISDTRCDPLLTSSAARDLEAELGGRALAAVPLSSGSQLLGWLVMQCTAPHVWQERELAICRDVARDLATSLVQVQAHEQQQQAVVRLEELNRAKDAFVSNISHELRTPLTSITGYLELIWRGDLGPLADRMAHGLEVVSRNADRLTALVENLLRLSALDAAELDRTPLDLGELVTACHQTLLPALDLRSLDFEIRIQPGLAPVVGERAGLEQVMLNLLTNAIKFTRDGGSVKVELDEGPSGAVLTVSDTGIGIPAAEQDHLFSRFFRSSLAIRYEIQGTGIGLALTRALVEQHGGSISIVSTEGKGTTVTVELPRDPK